MKASMWQKKIQVPPWVPVMYNSRFFARCSLHPDERRNSLGYFCPDCFQSVCPHCLPAHAGHHYMKIRRGVLQYEVNRGDVQKIFDCRGIQTYWRNKTSVIFLNRRRIPPRPLKYRCIFCNWRLHRAWFKYCSIECKVLHTIGEVKGEGD